MAVEMYVSGKSVGEVASAHGMSRQAMWKILDRRGVEFRPQLRFEKDNHFYQGGSARGKVNFVLQKAIRRGKIVVLPCESCGLAPLVVGGRQRIQGHHDDYNKLLEVRFLCQPCHQEWHRTHKAIPRNPNWKPSRSAK